MLNTRTHYYLWGLWVFWGGGIIAFLLLHGLSVLVVLIGVGCLVLLLLSPRIHLQGVKTNMFNFSKKDESGDAVKPAVVARTVEESLHPEPIADNNSLKETTISPGTILRGEIVNENNITINGEVEGDVTSKKITQIGKDGKVTGKMTTAKLVVNGLLKGCCYAKTVVIMSRGRVEGDIYASEFSIEKGGVFIGNSHWVEEAAEIKEKRVKTIAGDVSAFLVAPSVDSERTAQNMPQPGKK